MKATKKTTAREYKASYALLMDATRKMNQLRIEGEYTEAHELEELIKTYNKKYFDKLPTVNVQYSIGGRRYFREVVKLGKSFFEHGKRLPKRWAPKEIEEITDAMRKEMIADSYYY